MFYNFEAICIVFALNKQVSPVSCFKLSLHVSGIMFHVNKAGGLKPEPEAGDISEKVLGNSNTLNQIFQKSNTSPPPPPRKIPPPRLKTTGPPQKNQILKI